MKKNHLTKKGPLNRTLINPMKLQHVVSIIWNKKKFPQMYIKKCK